MNHYFTNDPNIKSKIIERKVNINNQDYVFMTDNGVFSKSNLDFGTRTLLLSLPALKGKVLDFGCGYGPIGIYIKKNNDCEVDMLDINTRSVELAKKNAVLNKVNVDVFESDMYSNVVKKYNYIITNPPIRVGKEKLYEILFSAKDYLEKNGQLWLVINKDQGAKSLMKDLEGTYKVKLVDKCKGFYIICALID